jgi:hypothetical protein
MPNVSPVHDSCRPQCERQWTMRDQNPSTVILATEKIGTSGTSWTPTVSTRN